MEETVFINKLVVSDKVLAHIKEEYLDDKGNLDFSKIFPAPEELDVEAGTRATVGLEVYLTKVCPQVKFFGSKEDKISKSDYKILEYAVDDATGLPIRALGRRELKKDQKNYGRNFEQVVELGKKQADNIMKFGADSYITWDSQHANYHWRPRETEFHDGYLLFKTRESVPFRIIEEWNKKFDNERFTYFYSSKETGVDTGCFTIIDGKNSYGDRYPLFSQYSYELSMELWNCKKKYNWDEKLKMYRPIQREEEMQ